MLRTRQLSTDESRSAFDVVLEVVNNRFGLLLGGGAGEDEEENVGVLLKVILDGEEDSWRYGKGSEGWASGVKVEELTLRQDSLEDLRSHALVQASESLEKRCWSACAFFEETGLGSSPSPGRRP